MGKRGYGLSEVLLILLILILLLSVAAYSVFAACPHGVTICGISYNCGGASDRVCPITFGADCCDPACPITDPDCPPDQACFVCGDGIVVSGEQCESPNTINNIYCSQSVEQCVGSKVQYRDDKGNCDASCKCSYDSFSPLVCEADKCGAVCSDSQTSTCTTSNGYPGTRTCNSTTCNWGVCVSSDFCGDGIVNGLEECDSIGSCEPGNTGRYCNSSCKWQVAPVESIASGNCFDGIDNDCDGEKDWDNAMWSSPTRGPEHGDNGCPVRVTSVSVNDSNPKAGSTIFITCGVSAGGVNVNSVFAYIDENSNGVFDSGVDKDCGWNEPPNYWTSGNASVVFLCSVGGGGSKRAACGIYSSSSEPFDRSYQSGSDVTTLITVSLDDCNILITKAECNNDPACVWYDECNVLNPFKKLSSYDDASGKDGTCKLKTDPAPTYSCSKAICGEVCDGSDFSACADYCGTGANAHLFYNASVCDTNTCSCSPYSVTDCNLRYDCNSASLYCNKTSSSEIRVMGANYTCSLSSFNPRGCGFVNNVLCNGPWTCNAANNCMVQGCAASSYTCHREMNGVWNWTLTSNMSSVVENCTDGYDNDCNGLVDCADPACSRDAVQSCCLSGSDATLWDHGIGFGAVLFDASHPPGDGNLGSPLCCGNNVSEYFFNIAGGACCDNLNDCVYFVPPGSCENHDYPRGYSHLYHCNNTVWDECTSAMNCKMSGSYYCGYNASDGGWRWRASLPGEICNDIVDNDCDSKVDCSDDECIGKCPFCPLDEDWRTNLDSCFDGVDNDCDNNIDGMDNHNCFEGQGKEVNDKNRGCDSSDPVQQGGDNLPPIAYYPDEDNPYCADMCSGIRAERIMVFDSSNHSTNVFGTPCGVEFSSWDGGTRPYCCGNDANEYYKNTLMNSNLNDDDPVLHACCNASSDCVDANGNCQLGAENFNLCFDGIDNDCDGKVDCDDVDDCVGGMMYGYIFDDVGKPVGGAIVKASPPVINPENARVSDPSSSSGYYYLKNPVVGEYYFIARKAGYDDNITRLKIMPKEQLYVNFTLRNSSCHADCTDYYGNCNRACDGLSFVRADGSVDTCKFDPEFVELCDNRPKGFVVKKLVTLSEYDDKMREYDKESPYYDSKSAYYDSKSGSDYVNSKLFVKQYTCCEGQATGIGGGVITYPVITPRISGNISDVRDEVVLVQQPSGEWVKMHVLVYRKE